MMSFGTLLSTILTLFLLLVCGWICGKLQILTEDSVHHLSALIVKVGQPFLIIHSLTRLEYSSARLRTGLMILLLGLGIHAVMSAIAYFACRPLQKKGTDVRKISEFAMVFTNCGFIGLPILESIFREEGSFYGAFYLIGFHLCTWTWGIAILARGRQDIRLTVRKALINLGTVPCLIGFLIFLSRIPLPAFLLSFDGYISSLCTPIAMLITGANLSRRSLRKMASSPLVYYVSAFRLIVIPIMITLLLWALRLPSLYIVFGGVMAAMPCAAIATMFGELYGIEPGLAAEYIGATSVLCTLTLLPVATFARTLAGI